MLTLDRFKTLGRFDLGIDDLLIVSRQHLEIRVNRQGDACVVRALHKNAIKVLRSGDAEGMLLSNDGRHHSATLKAGDIIEIGDVQKLHPGAAEKPQVVQYRVCDGPAPASPMAAAGLRHAVRAPASAAPRVGTRKRKTEERSTATSESAAPDGTEAAPQVTFAVEAAPAASSVASVAASVAASAAMADAAKAPGTADGGPLRTPATGANHTGAAGGVSSSSADGAYPGGVGGVGAGGPLTRDAAAAASVARISAHVARELQAEAESGTFGADGEAAALDDGREEAELAADVPMAKADNQVEGMAEEEEVAASAMAAEDEASMAGVYVPAVIEEEETMAQAEEEEESMAEEGEESMSMAQASESMVREEMGQSMREMSQRSLEEEEEEEEKEEKEEVVMEGKEEVVVEQQEEEVEKEAGVGVSGAAGVSRATEAEQQRELHKWLEHPSSMAETAADGSQPAADVRSSQGGASCRSVPSSQEQSNASMPPSQEPSNASMHPSQEHMAASFEKAIFGEDWVNPPAEAFSTSLAFSLPYGIHLARTACSDDAFFARLIEQRRASAPPEQEPLLEPTIATCKPRPDMMAENAAGEDAIGLPQKVPSRAPSRPPSRLRSRPPSALGNPLPSSTISYHLTFGAQLGGLGKCNGKSSQGSSSSSGRSQPPAHGTPIAVFPAALRPQLTYKHWERREEDDDEEEDYDDDEYIIEDYDDDGEALDLAGAARATAADESDDDTAQQAADTAPPAESPLGSALCATTAAEPSATASDQTAALAKGGPATADTTTTEAAPSAMLKAANSTVGLAPPMFGLAAPAPALVTAASSPSLWRLHGTSPTSSSTLRAPPLKSSPTGPSGEPATAASAFTSPEASATKAPKTLAAPEAQFGYASKRQREEEEEAADPEAENCGANMFLPSKGARLSSGVRGWYGK